MTLHRTILAGARPVFLATATGAALCSLSIVAHAQHPQALAAEPGLLPFQQQHARSINDSANPVSLASGQSGPNGDVHQVQPLGQPQNMTSGSPGNSRSGPRQTAFADRLGKLFTRKPTTPPVDPGMTYPKGSEQPTAAVPPPQAPGASNSVIPSIPPSYGVNTTPQPGLFQAPSSANAIVNDTLIPPSPAGLANQPAAPAAGSSGQPLPNIPELKALMTAQAGPAAPGPEPEVVQTSNLPKLDFNAPLPEVGPQIAPGEPTGTAGSASPSTVTGTPAATPKGADPFADLFPDDKQKTTAATPAPASGNQPYTGLSLEADSGKPMVEDLPPPPAEPGSKLAHIPALPPVTPEKMEPRTASVPEVPAAAPAKELPKLDLSVPGELPKLSNADSMDIQIKPAPSAAPAPAAPPASTPPEDQRSKLEQIAARKDLKGLKGFCPVVLRDERNLQDASFEFTVSHNGREYALSSAEARDKFLAEPAKYAPAAGGCDVIHLALTGEQQEGSLEYAVWYKGRLYLFSGVETMETFVAAPSSHATDD